MLVNVVMVERAAATTPARRAQADEPVVARCSR